MSNEKTLVEYGDGQMRPEHSNKGASGAERWMNCSGSSALITAMEIEEETDSPDYREDGVAMHEAAAHLLMTAGDAWEIAGETFNNREITPAMADAVQVYLDRVRASLGKIGPGYAHGHQFFVEAKLAAPDIHEAMFGSVDFGAIVPPEIAAAIVTTDDPAVTWEKGFLDVTDLKGGEGIEVDAEDNPQMKYYAFMLIHTKFPDLDDDFPVRLTIVQPRCFSYEGPVRDWWTTVGEIKAWVVRDLLPAMNSTDDNLEAGGWCRFCPAKLVCPLLTGLFNAAANYDPKAVVNINSEALGLAYNKIEAVKFYLKALEDTVFARLKSGTKVPHTKLVNKKAHRIFKDTVTVKVEEKEVEVDLPQYLVKMFGDAAYQDRKLKSPAEFEAVQGGKEFVKQYAYMPVTGLTVAREDDRRTGITVATASERFGAAIANLEKQDAE